MRLHTGHGKEFSFGGWRRSTRMSSLGGAHQSPHPLPTAGLGCPSSDDPETLPSTRHQEVVENQACLFPCNGAETSQQGTQTHRICSFFPEKEIRKPPFVSAISQVRDPLYPDTKTPCFGNGQRSGKGRAWLPPRAGGTVLLQLS